MFSGIVETQSRCLSVKVDGGLLRLKVERPASFDDLQVGDSICTNGVCLTIEEFDQEKMTFALGEETLKITGWTVASLQGAALNLERSLRFGDRIHGHLVSGHVDALGDVIEIRDFNGSRDIRIRAPKGLLPFIWRKGSWAVNGVSLTVNEVVSDIISICLIPETLKRTNLAALKSGDRVNLEIDMTARGLVHFLQAQELVTRGTL